MKFLSLFFSLILIGSISAQNLVQNPSFENFSSCPAGPSELDKANFWNDPFINLVGDTCSTSDYYNACSPLGAFGVGVPGNILGNEPARTGDGYAGIIIYEGISLFPGDCSSLGGSGWREYVQGRFTSPLVAGQEYCVSFWVSLADDVKWASNSFGVYLSNTEVLVDCGTIAGNSDLGSAGYTPQLTYAGPAITNTIGWTKLQWTYTATGGEEYIIIGNFEGNATTNYECSNADAFNPYAYYYIDDVSVELEACCDPAFAQVDPLCSTDGNITLTAGITGGTWSGPGIVNASTGEFSPASAGVGIHEVEYTLSCGTSSLNVVVAGCEDLEVCQNTDGTLTVTSGTGPYTWQELTPASSTPITNQAECEACGYSWTPFVNICLNGITEETTCDSPGGYQTIGTGTTITPGTNFPIRVIDAFSDELIINDVNDLPECTTTPCPTINVTIDNQSNVLCNGETNGSATVSASGGTGPYTYSWSPGNLSGATQNNLSAQTYTVSVLDADDCPGTIDVVISEPTALSAVTSSTEASCGEEDGSASITVSGGSGAYTYQWDPNVSTNNTATNLGAGSYDVTITDENNCVLQETILINNQNAPIISITETIDESCSGAADGSATVEVSGGTGAYTYSWDPSGGTGSTATNLGAGDYTVTVTDEANCSASVTVSIGTTNEIVLDANIIDEDCGQQNGQIQVTASGGTGVLSYSWDSGQNSASISNLPNGSYTITVEDEAGCSISATYDVDVIGSLDVTVNPVTATIEAGQSIDINAEGGFTYTWSPETGLSCTDCPNPTASPTSTTTYTVVAIDENGCAGEADVTIYVEAICGEIFVPTIFSPNSDNLNDRHCVLGGCISEFELIIYNRWGERVFVSNDASNCWDGVFRGKPVQTGVYVYKLKATLVDGTVITDSGNINVVK